MANGLLSVIIPVYNERGNIELLIDRLSTVLKGINHEIIFVDDGSHDGSAQEIEKYTKDKRIKLVVFNRNFGHQMALSAGYRYAQGDAVVSMDADLQDPPEVILKMYAIWKKGKTQVVYARREKREGETAFKLFSANFFYRLINALSDYSIPRDVGDFRLLDRAVVDYLNELPEQSVFLRGLVAWGGYPAEIVYFKRDRRNTGETHYTFMKMLNFALEGITSFSTKPLRLATLAGFASATIGFLGILYAIFGRFFLPSHWVTGWTGLFVGIMFIGGVQLITIGIIGEYIGKIYQEVQRRPKYIVREKYNIAAE